MYAYDAKDIRRVFGLMPATVRSLARRGHIQPLRLGSRFQYSFQDLLVLRTVRALRAAAVPNRQIHLALRLLQRSTDDRSLITRVSMTPNERIGVREGQSLWEADSGQYALTLEVPPSVVRVESLDQGTLAMQEVVKAEQHFDRGLRLEDTEPEAARDAYLACLECDPEHLEARINLGRLLHLAGELQQAESIYLECLAPSALLAYNLATLLEDLGREQEAEARYQQALSLDPAMADAHFNLALVHERAGHAHAAFRHFLAYRRLTQRGRR